MRQLKSSLAISHATSQEDVHDAFVDLLVAKVRVLQLGPGSDPGTTHGPLITAAAVDGVRGQGVQLVPGLMADGSLQLSLSTQLECATI